jgi:hypothetical protein
VPNAQKTKLNWDGRTCGDAIREPECLGLSYLTMAGAMVVREQESLQC